MLSESYLLPLSGPQHLAFGGRQWALIHREQQWVENRPTVVDSLRFCFVGSNWRHRVEHVDIKTSNDPKDH